jgi:hypothetical protein
VLGQLADKFKEHVVAHASSSDGQLIEWTASLSGSWTMILTDAAGNTCLLASGDRWISKPWPDHET